MAKRTGVERDHRSHKDQLRRRCAAKKRGILGYDRLENRNLMALIVWGNRAEFDNEFGGDTAVARQVIDQALLDWGAAIDSFNYRNVGQSGWSPSASYTINISVKDWQAEAGNSNTLARCGPVGIDADGKPFSGEMFIDDNAAGSSWWFDPSPWNDAEFPNPVAPFAATGGPGGHDLYTVVLHELGHGLGLATNSNLAIRSRIANHAFTFADGTTVSLTNDDAHFHATVHRNDLMTPSIGSGQRRTISDLNARILGEGFGFTIDLRFVHQRSFVATYNPVTRQLTINGDLGKTQAVNRVFDQIYLNAMVDDIFVDVNGYPKWISTHSVDSLLVIGGAGNDEIRVEATQAGKPLSINAGQGNNFVFLSDQIKNLSNIQGDVTIFEDGGRSNVNFMDTHNSASRTFTVDQSFVRFSGSNARIRYTGYVDSTANVYGLILRGGSGGNTFTVNNSLATETFTRLLAGDGNDVVNIFSTGIQGITIDGVNGFDRVTLGANFLSGMRDILGSVYVSSTSGYVDLILNDAGDPIASTNVRVNVTSISGVGPAEVRFDPRGISSITLIASTGLSGVGNTIRVINTPQNRDGNLTFTLRSGQFDDVVRVDATTSRLNIDGQNGMDSVTIGNLGRLMDITGAVSIANRLGLTALTINNSVDTTHRTGTLSDRVFRLSTAQVNFNESRLQSLTFFGGTRSTLTVNDTSQNANGDSQTNLYLGSEIDTVNVLKTTGALFISGRGGFDAVTIGANGLLNQINGSVEVVNTPSYTDLKIDGSREAVARVFMVDASSLRGAPAEIKFRQTDLRTLTISGGSAGNTFDILNTPQNGPGDVLVTINSGAGADLVNVQRIRSNTWIHGQNSADIVNIGQNGRMSGIAKQLYITNASSYSTINVDNSLDSNDRTVTMNVTNTGLGWLGVIQGITTGEIVYRQSDLRALNVRGGLGRDTFKVFNTAKSNIPNGSPTTIRPGAGGDTVQVAATTGSLVLEFDGTSNRATIGNTGTVGGSLTSLRGAITLRSLNEAQTDVLEIIDRSSTGRYVYTLDSQNFGRTSLNGNLPIAPIEFGEFSVNRLLIEGANQGNRFVVNGTPEQNNYGEPETGFTIRTGDGNDELTMLGGGLGPLSIDLGGGVSQPVTIGDAANSLDNIRSELVLSGLGYVPVSISDAASTTAHLARIDWNGARHTFERSVLENGQYRQLNNLAFELANQGKISYQAGRVVSGSYNEINVAGVAANTEVIINGGADYEIFSLGSTGDLSKILGPVTLNSPEADPDFAFFSDSASSLARNYTLRTNPLNSSGVVVEGTALPGVTYNGMTQLVFFAPFVSGDQLAIQSLPADLFLNLAVGNDDSIAIGNPTPSGSRTTQDVLGPIQIGSYNAGDSVELWLDDSGNATSARNVTITDHQSWGVVNGMTGSAALFFSDLASWNVNILGGTLDDSLIMSGRVLAANVALYGGAGNDILIGSGGNNLFGGIGRDLIVAGAVASLLDGGQDEDILIGGRLNNITSPNLNAIRTIWTGAGDYDSRVGALRVGLLADSEISGNEVSETMTGGLDAYDLFFGDPLAVTDLEEAEYLFMLS